MENKKAINVALRVATASDRAFMKCVFIQSAGDRYAKQFGWTNAEVETWASERSYDLEHSKIIVVDGIDQGWETIVMRTADETHIDSIFLLPEAQGHGIGTKIINGLITEAMTNNKALSLCVFKANEGARRLYERLGFVVAWDGDDRVCMLFSAPHS